jgi:hypothetical protein
VETRTVMTMTAAEDTVVTDPNWRLEGRREWRHNGQLHREYGPALDYPEGREWYRNGQLHREDGPAVEMADGYRGWLLNGQFHREDGPAVVHPSGRREWYARGVAHRMDGPALEWPKAKDCRWFVSGVALTAEEATLFQSLDARTKEAVAELLDTDSDLEELSAAVSHARV